jgi:high-affinity Fe2+/Pb2+ permease
MGRVRGWEVPDAAVGSGCGVNPSHLGQPLDAVRVSGRLVPVTTWMHSEQLISARPYRAAGRYKHWTRNPYALGGLVVAAIVVATLVACLVIVLLALVAWVTAHAVAVGVGLAAVVVTGLAFLRALTSARTTGPPPHGGCCR